MEKYRAFISYRKSNAEKAELVKTSLIDKHGFDADEIFLDKHDIGPERYDEKLKNAVLNSASLVLIVTRDCFNPKNEGEDWYLEEIQTALDNGITIIPVFFDGIKSLDTKEIRAELDKSFIEEEIEKLTKTQSIRYDFDLSDATFAKLSRFIEKVDISDAKTKTIRIIKGIFATLVVFAIVFALFIGVGFLWGYYSSSNDDKSILLENTRVEGNTAIFEFGGLEASYDLDKDSIVIDLESFNGELPKSNFEMLANSCSVSGAVLLFKQNIGSIKYLKYIKGGSKPSKIARAAVTVAAFLGSFLGFSQGSEWGRTLSQKEHALALFPRLKNKDEWRSVIHENTLLNKRFRNLQFKRSLSNDKYALSNDKYALIWCYPDDEIDIAKNAGLTDMCVVCKFNNWEIGKSSAQNLYDEIEKSRSIPKDVVIAAFDTIHRVLEYKHLILPAGIVGIRFSYPNTKLNHQDTVFSFSMIYKYNAWKRVNVRDTL